MLAHVMTGLGLILVEQRVRLVEENTWLLGFDRSLPYVACIVSYNKVLCLLGFEEGVLSFFVSVTLTSHIDRFGGGMGVDVLLIDCVGN